MTSSDAGRNLQRYAATTRRAGFEPATVGLEIRCSVRLSYRREEYGNRRMSGRVHPFSLPDEERSEQVRVFRAAIVRVSVARASADRGTFPFRPWPGEWSRRSNLREERRKDDCPAENVARGERPNIVGRDFGDRGGVSVDDRHGRVKTRTEGAAVAWSTFRQRRFGFPTERASKGSGTNRGAERCSDRLSMRLKTLRISCGFPCGRPNTLSIDAPRCHERR